MERLFNMNNRFFTFMGRIADLIVLNILFMVCCIPIVTIGSALTALFYVELKAVRNEESYIIRSFFKAFRDNFRQSTILWLIMLATGALLYVDFAVLKVLPDSTVMIVRYGLWIITLLYTMVSLYLYALQAKFYNPIKNTLKNALLMSIKHLPYTLMMLLTTIIPVVLVFFSGNACLLIYGLFVWLMIGFSGIGFINSWCLMRVFDNYIPKETETLE